MNHKRLFLFSGAFFGMLIFAGAVFYFHRDLDPDPINQVNCDKINVGMTLEDVEKHLSGMQEQDAELYSGMFSWTGTWLGKRGWITVDFDEAGLVHRAEFTTNDPSLRILHKIRTWLGLSKE